MHSLSRVTASLAVCALLWPEMVVAYDVTPIAQARSVQYWFNGNISKTTAPTFGEFNAGFWSGSSVASQNSTITGPTVTGTLTARATKGDWPFVPGDAARSTLSYTFSVNAPVSYSVDATFSAFEYYDGFGEAYVELLKPDNTHVFAVGVSVDHTFSLTGILDPGTYTLSADAFGSSHSYAELQFTFLMPEPTTGAFMLLAAFAVTRLRTRCVS